MWDLGFRPKPFHNGPVIWSPDRPGPLYLPEHGEAGYLWIPQKGQIRVQHNTGAVGTTTVGTAVTTGGAASTKGTPAEISASTSFDSFWMTVVASAYGLTATDAQLAIDILIGAATEEVLVANLLGGGCGTMGVTTHHGCRTWNFPLYTPSGSRIAVQAAGARVSTAFQVAVYLFGGTGMPPYRVGSKVTTYGMGTVPNGTTLTVAGAGGAASFTQITASTTEDHFALFPSVQVGADTVWNAGTLNVQFGVGAATEEIVGGSYWFTKDTGEVMDGPYPSFPTFHDVPSGTRLTLGVSHSGTNDASYNGVIHAVS